MMLPKETIFDAFGPHSPAWIHSQAFSRPQPHTSQGGARWVLWLFGSPDRRDDASRGTLDHSKAETKHGVIWCNRKKWSQRLGENKNNRTWTKPKPALFRCGESSAFGRPAISRSRAQWARLDHGDDPWFGSKTLGRRGGFWCKRGCLRFSFGGDVFFVG